MTLRNVSSGFTQTTLSLVFTNSRISGNSKPVSLYTATMFGYILRQISSSTVLSLPPLNETYTPSSPQYSTQSRIRRCVIRTLISSGRDCI